MRKQTIICALIGLLSLPAAAAPKVTGAQVVEPFYRLVCEVFTKPYIPISLAVLMWAYAGAKWIYSQDDDEQRLLAKDIAVYVIVGLMFLILAPQIVYIIFGVTVCPP